MRIALYVLLLVAGLSVIVPASIALEKKDIILVTNSNDYEKTRALLFSKGYSLKIKRPDDIMDNLTATEKVIVIDDNRKWELNALIKLYKFTSDGGRAIYIFNKRTDWVPDINDILGTKYNFMIVNESFNFKKKNYQGGDLCHLWKGLVVGPDCNRELFVNYMIPVNISVVKSKTKKDTKQVVTSIEMSVGKGKILFLCMPYFDSKSCGEYPIMFADSGIEKFENINALIRMCDYLLTN